jgi:hypothetical protein
MATGMEGRIPIKFMASLSISIVPMSIKKKDIWKC